VRRWRLALSALVFGLLLAYGFRDAILRATIGIALALQGYSIAYDALDLGWSSARVEGLRLGYHGTRLLEATRLEAGYDLPQVFWATTRRYGLTRIEAEAPIVRIRRGADGSWNLPAGNGALPAGAAGAGVPLRFAGSVRGGSILLDDAGHAPEHRAAVLSRVEGTFSIDTSASGRCDFRGALDGGGPVRLACFTRAGNAPPGGRSAGNQVARVRLQAQAVPLARLLAVFVNSGSLAFTGGTVRNLDAYLYAHGGGPYHLTGSGRLDALRLVLHAILAPLSFSGNISLVDGGLAARDLTGAAGPLPLHGAALLYGLPADGQLAIGAQAEAPLQEVGRLFEFSRRLPLAGSGKLRVSVTGSAADPIVLAALDAPAPSYGGRSIGPLAARAGYFHDEVDVIDARTGLDGIALHAAGGLDTAGAHAPLSLAIFARGEAAEVPYLGHLIGPGRVLGEAAGSGPGDAFAGSAVLWARGNDGSTAAAPASFTLRGAVAAPFVATQPGGGSIAGRVVRSSAGLLVLWADARRYRLEGDRAIDLGDSGRIAGTLDGTAALAGTVSALSLAGSATLHHARLGSLDLDEASAQLVPAPGGSRFTSLRGSGPFGSFAGSGELEGSQLAIQGNYDGSFERLRSLTGDLGGKGCRRGPLGIVLDERRLVLQTTGLRTPGASVRGIPLGGIAGTIVLAGKDVTVAAAQAGLAGGSASAAGRLSRLSFVATGLNARQLRGSGLPLAGGRVSIAGTAGLSGERPSFEGGLVLNGGAYGKVPISGSGLLRFTGERADFSAAGTVANAPSGASGSVRLGGGRAAPPQSFSLAATTFGLSSAELTRAGLPLPARLRAAIDGDFRVEGTLARPRVRGRLAIPVGRYGLLPFTAASATFEAGNGSAAIRAGAISFGPDRVTFAGRAERNGDFQAAFLAPELNLANLDLYYERWGTLAGRGSSAARVQRAGGVLTTAGDAQFNGLVVLRPAGDASARWRTRSGVVVGSAALSAQGNYVHSDFRIFPALDAPLSAPLQAALVTATIRAEDGNVLRDASLLVPPGFPSVQGSLTAAGVLEGRFPDLALTGTARIRDGAFGPYPFTLASLSVRADRAGATITDWRLVAGGSKANGSGYLAFRAPNRVDIRAALDSPQVHDLLSTFSNRAPPLFGSLQATVHLTGSLKHLAADGAAFIPGGSFDGVAFSRAVASFGLSGRNVQLRDASIAFPKGRVVLAGTFPFQVNPFSIGPPGAPIGFDFTADDLDISAFKPVLPKGSQLSGILAGTLGVSGVVSRPALFGSLGLAGGTLAAPFLSNPLTAINAELALSGSQLQLRRLSAKAGPGLLEATATIAVQDGALAVAARLRAQRAVLGSPDIGSGTIDAGLAFDRAPHRPGVLSGTMSLSDATIPFSALYAPAAAAGPSKLPHLLLDVRATVGKNVRVRSGNVDIAGSGSMLLSGSLDDPRLDGTLTAAPGGTIVFGNRAFRLQDGRVTFSPSSGLDPALAATATVSVPNSDPDVARNPTASASVALQVTGTLSNPTVSLTSTPSYSSEQILGLLLGAQALGASLFASPGPAGSTGHGTPGTGTQLGQEALGVVSAQFTRLLLAPFETSLSEALGLTSIDFNLGGASAVGVSARKLLNKDIFAIYSSGFLYPYRQTFGFELRARRYTSAQLTYYTSLSTGNQYYVPVTSPFLNQGSIGAYALNQVGDTGITFSIRQYYPPP
jgi:hypothetical protein